MKTVYKYRLDTTDVQIIQMPKGAEILTVQFNDWSGLCLWALVDPTQELENVKIRIAGTGHHIEEDIMKYIGTLQLQGGALVFHAFVIN